MPNCVDCGKEVIEIESGAIELRCLNCEYRLNINKSIKRVTEYCLITLGVLIIGIVIFELILNLLFTFLF